MKKELCKPFGEAEAQEELVRGHSVVARVELLVVWAGLEVDDRVEQANDRDAVLQRQPLEQRESR